MEILSLLEENRKLLNKIFRDDKELAEIKKKLREETGILPENYDDYIIATGHQPVPYYPGLLFKNFFTGNQSKKTGVKAYNFIVDSDKGSVKISVPFKQNNEYRKEILTLKEDPHSIFEGFQPTEKTVNDFLQSVRKHLKTLEKEEFYKTFTVWKNKFFNEYKQNNSFIDALINLRTQQESSLGVSLINKKISGIAKSTAYYRFISYIIKHIEKFKEAYNNSVKKKSKGDYQPVKIMHEEDGWIELPFWLIQDNKRYPVKIKKEQKKLRVASEEADFKFSVNMNNWDNLSTELKNKILLYPKATTLTFMIRLFFCDLFVHGTGAVEYELVNNDFFQSFFHLEKTLSFYAVTGNIYLPLLGNKLNHEDLQKRYSENKKWLKEAQRNPEDLLDKETADNYKNKKKELATRMKNEKDGDKRKKLHRKLEDLNEEMKTFLKDQVDTIKKEVSRDEYILHNEEIFLERYYPYFIYPPNSLTVDCFHNNIVIKEYDF